MRLLHTSDWHLGQTFHQFDRSREHARFLTWLLDRIEEHAVDALLISGDVFDSANPPAAAQAQFYRFLTAARERVAHLNIVVTAGNHDSPGRLEAPTPFLELLDATVVGQFPRAGSDSDLQRIVVPLRDRNGSVGAWCIAMPYLRPGDVEAPDDAADAYGEGVRLAYGRALAAALEMRKSGQAIVAMGHCHLSGGQVSAESERRIVIGGAEALAASVFDPQIAYVALGHLHLAQAVGGDPTRRYCGSPLPLSFSETGYPHQVVIVDLDGAAVKDIRPLRVPRPVELLRIPESPAPLNEVLATLALLDLPACDEADWPYLQVRVLLDQPEPGLRIAVETALAGKPVRLAGIEPTRAKSSTAAAENISLDALDALAPQDLFARLYRHRFDSDAPAELMRAFVELVNAVPEEAGEA